MLSHTYTGVTDFERADAFYAPIMAHLGLRLKFRDAAHGWAGWMPAHAARPLFLIGRAFEGEATPGNGQMLALLAPSRAAVDALHALALRLGGRCEGPPGLRPHYHPDYYGAYLRDPDGNKLSFCCHEPE
jgi:catechol 2,3-dioxygenase-like lactoylglutathione lyase family enzyme